MESAMIALPRTTAVVPPHPDFNGEDGVSVPDTFDFVAAYFGS
jgi:hypothetical protein